MTILHRTSALTPFFRADSPLVQRIEPSPNFTPFQMRVRGVMVHSTMNPDAEHSLRVLTDPHRLPEKGGRVSAHYLIMPDGEVVQLVGEAHVAWHAGHSAHADWHEGYFNSAGKPTLNYTTIGVELANGPDSFFPPEQLAQFIRLARDIQERHGVTGQMVGHDKAATAVGRADKRDPGPLFPWAAMAAAGVAPPDKDVFSNWRKERGLEGMSVSR